MSVLFPKVQKPRAWDYRPIYYDEQKEKQKKVREKLDALRRENQEQSEQQKDEASAEAQPMTDYVPTLHRGSFREARELSEDFRHKSQKQSKTIFFIALLFLLLFFYWLLK